MPVAIVAPLVIFVALAVVFGTLIRRASRLLRATREADLFRLGLTDLAARVDRSLAGVVELVDAVRRHQRDASTIADNLTAAIDAMARYGEEAEEPTYTETLSLDLSTVVPSIAGPKRPQDRVSLTESKAAFRMALDGFLPDEDLEDEAVSGSFPASDPVSLVTSQEEEWDGDPPATPAEKVPPTT